MTRGDYKSAAFGLRELSYMAGVAVEKTNNIGDHTVRSLPENKVASVVVDHSFRIRYPINEITVCGAKQVVVSAANDEGRDGDVSGFERRRCLVQSDQSVQPHLCRNPCAVTHTVINVLWRYRMVERKLAKGLTDPVGVDGVDESFYLGGKCGLALKRHWRTHQN